MRSRLQCTSSRCRPPLFHLPSYCTSNVFSTCTCLCPLEDSSAASFGFGFIPLLHAAVLIADLVSFTLDRLIWTQVSWDLQHLLKAMHTCSFTASHSMEMFFMNPGRSCRLTGSHSPTSRASGTGDLPCMFPNLIPLKKPRKCWSCANEALYATSYCYINYSRLDQVGVE